MKTDKHKFLGYFETTGGPVCICELSRLHAWSGAESEEGDYWKMLEETDSMKYLDSMILAGVEAGGRRAVIQ